MELRRFAMSWVHFDRAQILTQVDARFSGTVWPPNESRCKLASVLFSLVRARLQGRTEMAFFATCVELASICEPVWPPIANLCSQVHIC